MPGGMLVLLLYRACACVRTVQDVVSNAAVLCRAAPGIHEAVASRVKGLAAAIAVLSGARGGCAGITFRECCCCGGARVH